MTDDDVTSGDGRFETTIYAAPKPQIDHEALEDVPRTNPADDSDLYEIRSFRYDRVLNESTWTIDNGPWQGFEITLPGHMPAAR